MSSKHQRIEAAVAPFQGRALDAHFLAYVDLFNRQRFYEAHDALEALWLRSRHEPDGEFHKGLIQLAGAFVHVQKNRRAPAAALLRLAQRRLAQYPASHWRLNLPAVLALVEAWLRRLESGASLPELLAGAPPRLDLRPE
jgi:predicted metal-dependent hydrolase